MIMLKLIEAKRDSRQKYHPISKGMVVEEFKEYHLLGKEKANWTTARFTQQVLNVRIKRD